MIWMYCMWLIDLHLLGTMHALLTLKGNKQQTLEIKVGLDAVLV